MQNSKKEDYQTIMRLFYNRIAGHDPVLVKTDFICRRC